MSRSLPVVRLLDGLIELGWLFLLIAVPIFFNVRDARIFEPDKIVLLRNTTLVMVALWGLKGLYLAPLYLGQPERTAAGLPERPATIIGRLRALARANPILAAMAVFMFVYLLAMLNSLIPRISFWGSYDRLEGFYTYLSYAAILLLVATQLRTWAQLERIVTAVIVASVPVCTYSWVQHFKIDPFIWGVGSEVQLRTPSTLGNPIFMAAFVLMTVPFTLYRLILRLQALLAAGRTPTGQSQTLWEALGAAGYGVALLLQIAAIGFSGSRGPALGFLAALVVFAFVAALRLRIAWLLRGTVAVAAVLLLLFGATNTVFKSGTTPNGGVSRFLHVLPSESDTSEVRSLLWRTSVQLWQNRPLLGCGQEVLIFCWYPHFPTELRKVEAANAAPDRSHDEELDVLLMSGALGLLAYLAVIASAVYVQVQLLRRARDLRSTLFASALLAAFVGHIVEGVTGIAFSATLLLLWLIAGVASALYARADTEAGRDFAATLLVDDLLPTIDLVPMAPATPVVERPARPVAMPSGGRAQPRGSRTTPVEGGRAGARNQAGGRRAETPRGGAARMPRYAFAAALARLPSGLRELVALGALAYVATLIGFGALFVTNIQQILADVDFQQGLNAEQGAGKVDYQTALNYYPIAFNYYQAALDSQPNEDIYSVDYGKTFLEYANAQRQTGASRATVESSLQHALDIFTRAAKNNPLNPDHPRNTAKLYDLWGAELFGPPIDTAKLELSDHYFSVAHGLAPRNGDILDEWGRIDVKLAAAEPGRASHWLDRARQSLELARDLNPESGNIYQDLGNVYNQYASRAESAHDAPATHQYYVKTRDNWLTALGGPPVRTPAVFYHELYAPLAQLLITKFRDRCGAGQYAFYAIQAIGTGTATKPDPTTLAGLQGVLADAQMHGCRIQK